MFKVVFLLLGLVSWGQICAGPFSVSQSQSSVAPASVVSKLRVSTTVLFERNAMEVSGDERQLLIDYANTLNGYDRVITVSVIGYTDSRGDFMANDAVSVERARLVADFLVSQGVSRGIITWDGQGERNPVASNESWRGRNQNRRVVLEAEVLSRDSRYQYP